MRPGSVRVSLRLKVFAVTLGLSALSVIGSALILAHGHRESLRESAREDALALSVTISEYARGALVFEDEQGARDILQNLAANPAIAGASLCDATGKALARLGTSRDGCPRQRDDRAPHIETRPGVLWVDQSIRHQGDRVGALHLEISTARIDSRMVEDLIGLGFACTALLVVCALLASRLSRVITDPVLRLAGIMRRVDGEQLLQERPTPPSDDEIGELYRGFNSMLDQLREHMDRRRALEQRLLQAHKLEAVGQLAGGVAHDFNNLLGGLMGYAELLRASSNADERERYASELIGICERAAQLTSRLLGFARKSKSQSTTFDLNELVERTAAMLRRTVDPRIEISTSLAHDIVVEGEIAQMESAVLNLGVNARDAMPSGGRLIFKTHRCEISAPLPLPIRDSDADGAPALSLSPGRYAVLEVLDTGGGIPDDILPRVFEPFFTTKERGKGSGLGLKAVADAARAHHGGILVDSQAIDGHRGARFRLFLPLGQGVIDGVHGARARTTARSDARAGSAHVLLADDDPAIRASTGRLLELAGYTVTCVASGNEALAIVEQRPVSIIVLDLIMPDVHGADVLKQLRQRHPGLPILVISGYSAPVPEGKELRPDGFLAKPFTSEQLERAVAELLERRVPASPEARVLPS